MKKYLKSSRTLLWICLYLLLCIFVLAGTYQSYYRMILEKQLSNRSSSSTYYSNRNNSRTSALSRASSIASSIMGKARIRYFDPSEQANHLDYLVQLQSPESITGGHYLISPTSELITLSDLPTGYPGIDLTEQNQDYFFTSAYSRSTDNLMVITLYELLSDGWWIAADITPDYFAERFFPGKKTGNFYYLVDTNSWTILSHHDQTLIGLTLEEADTPLLPKKIQRRVYDGLHTIKDEDGMKYYWGTTRLQGTPWLQVHYHTKNSLKDDALKYFHEYYEPSPWPLVGLVGIVLVLLGFALFLPKQKETPTHKNISTP